MNARDLQKLPLLRMVPRPHLTEALEHALTPFQVGPGEVLLVEGEADDSLLIVVEGELDILAGSPQVRVAQLGAGEILGDMALFGGTGTRTAGVRTRTAVKGLVLTRAGMQTLRTVGNDLVPVLETQALRGLAKRLRLMDNQITQMAAGTDLATTEPEGLLQRLRGWLVPPDPNPQGPAPSPLDVLNSSPAFAHLSDDLRAALARELEPVAAPQGALVIQEGKHGGDAFVVASGRIDVYRATRTMGHERLAQIGPGELFGVVALVHGAVRSATCYAGEPTWLIRLRRELWDDLAEMNNEVAQAMRLVLYEALSRHLRAANSHVAALVTALAQDPTITDKQRASYRAMVVEVTG